MAQRNGYLNGKLRPILSCDLYSTPESTTGVTATSETLSVETGPLYGKETGTQSCRMNYVQATRTLLVFPRNNQGTECTHFNSSRSSLLRKCRPVLSVPPFGQDGTRRSLGCSGEFPKRMEGPVLSGAAWVYKRAFRPFCISALGAFFRWEKDFGLARRPTAPAGYSYFSPRRASPAPPSAGGPGLPRLWSVRPVALPPGPQANARGRLPSTS